MSIFLFYLLHFVSVLFWIHSIKEENNRTVKSVLIGKKVLGLRIGKHNSLRIMLKYEKGLRKKKREEL